MHIEQQHISLKPDELHSLNLAIHPYAYISQLPFELPRTLPPASNSASISVLSYLLKINAPSDAAFCKIDSIREKFDAAIGLMRNRLSDHIDDATKPLLLFQSGDYEAPLFSKQGVYTAMNSSPKHDQVIAIPYLLECISRDETPSIVDATWDISFRGSLLTHPVRKSLVDLSPKYQQQGLKCQIMGIEPPAPGIQELTYRAQYVEQIMQSRFVLCPRGDGLGSYRLFETMAMGRIPVIIADRYQLPLETIIDYRPISVKIPEADIESLPEYIAEFAGEFDLLVASQRVKAVYEKFLHPSSFFSLIASSLNSRLGTRKMAVNIGVRL